MPFFSFLKNKQTNERNKKQKSFTILLRIYLSISELVLLKANIVQQFLRNVVQENFQIYSNYILEIENVRRTKKCVYFSKQLFLSLCVSVSLSRMRSYIGLLSNIWYSNKQTLVCTNVPSNYWPKKKSFFFSFKWNWKGWVEKLFRKLWRLALPDEKKKH